MKDTFKRNLWISVSIIVGSIMLAWIGVYLLSGQITGQVKKIIADRSIVAQQATALASLADLKRDAPKAAPYENAINTLLPDQYQLIGFSEWLDGRGKQFSVTTHFSLQGTPAPSAPGTVGTAPFSADAEGSAENLLAFMKDIEIQAPAFLLSISSVDFVNDGLNSRVTFQGTLYTR